VLIARQTLKKLFDMEINFLISFVIAAFILLSVSLLLHVFDGCLSITFKHIGTTCITENFVEVAVYVDCTLKPTNIKVLYTPVCFFSKKAIRKQIEPTILYEIRRVVLKNSTDFVLHKQKQLAKKIEFFVSYKLYDMFSVENLSISNVEKC
jgi:hypothetical protein